MSFYHQLNALLELLVRFQFKVEDCAAKETVSFDWLCTVCGIQPGNVSKILQRLEQDGFIESAFFTNLPVATVLALTFMKTGGYRAAPLQSRVIRGRVWMN
jgi:hypothetical protein